MITSFTQARQWLPNSVAGGVATGVVTFGAVAAGAAIVEAALIPGLLIGGAAILAPRFLPRDMLSGLGDRLWRTAPSPVPEPEVPAAHVAEAPASSEPEGFDTWRAVVKTLTYRVMVTTADFGANYFVIGELATAAGLSSLSLVAGPIAYFAHEAAWHYYGPATARHANPLEAMVHLPFPGGKESSAANGGDAGQTRLGNLKMSRALAKTITYEGVTGVSEFSVNYLFVRDLTAAAGLTAFSIVIAPFVYYVHEKLWDHYDSGKSRSPAAAAPKLLPAA